MCICIYTPGYTHLSVYAYLYIYVYIHTDGDLTVKGSWNSSPQVAFVPRGS